MQTEALNVADQERTDKETGTAGRKHKTGQARKDYAALDVSYTVITAPADGYTSKITLQEGQLVQPGQTLMSVVDENDVWVVANYKETQTAKMKPGDRVRITVDAIPGIEYVGVIEAMSNATGHNTP